MKTLKLLSVAMAALVALPSFSFSMSSDGIVGPPASKISDATVRTSRLGQDGASVVQEGHSRYTEPTIRKNTYTCADLGGTPVATQAGLSATTPALTLWNPAGSGVNLIVNTATVGFTTLSGTTTFVLGVSTGVQTAPTATTTGQVMNNLIGNGASPLGQCYRVATLNAAPLMARVIGSQGGGTNTGTSMLIDHVDGELAIAPGELLTIQTLTSAATIVASFSWEELAQ